MLFMLFTTEEKGIFELILYLVISRSGEKGTEFSGKHSGVQFWREECTCLCSGAFGQTVLVSVKMWCQPS